MIRVNLLGAERQTKKTKQKKASTPSAPGAVQAYLFLALFGGGAVVLCAALYWYQSSKLQRLDADIATAQQRQRELQAIKVQVDALEAKRATFQRKVDLIERLKADQSGPVHLVDEISKALPDFVWLTAMEQTGDNVRLTGQGNGLTSVADFISALQRSGWFPNVDLVSSAQHQTQANVIIFALLARFKDPAVAAREAAAAAAAAAERAANPPPSPGPRGGRR
jgi:type IV pilus assembly protein PilN